MPGFVVTDPPVCSAREGPRTRVARGPRRGPPGGRPPSTSLSPRDDIVRERADGEGRFVQDDGPFLDYERTVSHDRDGSTIEEQTTLSVRLPVVRVAVRPADSLDDRPPRRTTRPAIARSPIAPRPGRLPTG